MLVVGDKAPDFCLQDQNEDWGCLKDFIERWVILYFYPKDNTPGCTNEGQDFSLLKNKFESKNAIVFGISPDPVLSHQRFAEKRNISIRLLSDEKKNTIRDYDVWQHKLGGKIRSVGVERSTFLINPDGNIVSIWKDVTVQGHATTVYEHLLDLLA